MMETDIDASAVPGIVDFRYDVKPEGIQASYPGAQWAKLIISKWFEMLNLLETL
jgi:hypothetical protein